MVKMAKTMVHACVGQWFSAHHGERTSFMLGGFAVMCASCIGPMGPSARSDHSRQALWHAYQNSRTSRICSLPRALQQAIRPQASLYACIARSSHESLSRLLSPKTLLSVETYLEHRIAHMCRRHRVCLPDTCFRHSRSARA